MNKKFRKILATVSAVAMCATSIVSMSVGAIGLFTDEKVTPDTISFYIGDYKYQFSQQATDFIDWNGFKIYITDSDTYIEDTDAYFWQAMAVSSHVSPLQIGNYFFTNKEDPDIFILEKYLSDNGIEYRIDDSSDYELFIIIEFSEGTTISEKFDVWKQIKEDTGLMVHWSLPEVVMLPTDIKNALPEPTLLGDANEDGEVNLADAVLIMQALSNPSEYKLTPQGIANADVIGDDGITPMDALTIQEMGINK